VFFNSGKTCNSREPSFSREVRLLIPPEGRLSGGFRTKSDQSGMQIVPVIRYVCLVGPLLLSMLFLFGEPDKPATTPAPDLWTSVDSLRAVAHLGEPVQGRAGNARFVRTERTLSEPAGSTGLAKIAALENPVIMNAQANMDSQGTARQPAAAKSRKSKMAVRQVRTRTAVAEAQRVETFRPPSW
jgi:hypothetical protein